MKKQLPHFRLRKVVLRLFSMFWQPQCVIPADLDAQPSRQVRGSGTHWIGVWGALLGPLLLGLFWQANGTVWAVDDLGGVSETRPVQDDGISGSQSSPEQNDTVEFWVTQLAHDHYLRRELAEKKLIEAGPSAVPALAKALRNGDLETIQRATSVMTRIATEMNPSEDGGAWNALVEVSNRTAGQIAYAARIAVKEIGDERETIAIEKLKLSGVFVGDGQFSLGATIGEMMMLKIDKGWDGDTTTLQWLPWVTSVRRVTLVGPAVQTKVLQQIVKMPNLKSLSIIEGDLQPGAIDALSQVKTIDELEFRYIQLSQDQANRVAQLPIRSKLSIMGTGINQHGVLLMQANAPHLLIEHRNGGFLGVQCDRTEQLCLLSDVVKGSAAEAAGLKRNDVILQINDTVVERFEDLQNEISKHVPGHEVLVVYLRHGKKEQCKLKLRRHTQ